MSAGQDSRPTGQAPGEAEREARDRAFDEWLDDPTPNLNTMMAVEAGPEHRTETLARCAEADAAEVVKWSALARALAPGEA